MWSGLKAAYGPKPGNEPDRRRRVRYPAGRVIGGGSSINGMASNRGLPSDYDAWAAAGATGWDWSGVLPFFKKLETDSDFDGPLHGKDGPIRLQRYASERWPGFTRGVMKAVETRAGTTSPTRMRASRMVSFRSPIATPTRCAWARPGVI